MNEQLDLFGFAPSQYIIKKPIRLIELFVGIGAQSKALEVLKANFESYKIAEWSKESIKAYTYIHHYEEIKNCNDKEINSLSGISRNYNEPMTKEQINNLKEDEKILLTNCKKITHNLIDISKVKGEDLNIVDTDKYEYIMTFSFPCGLKGEKIKTEAGYKNIEDVEVGDYVLTHTNTYKKVVKTMTRQTQGYYKIKYLGGESLLTSEHPLYVYRDSKFQWVKVKDLKLTDRVSFNVNNKEIDVNLSNEYLWLLGRYVADGWVNKYLYNSVEFAIGNKKEDDFLKNIPQDLRERFKRCQKSCLDYRIANKELKQYCLQFGQGAKNKKIPEWVFNLPKSKLQSFFDGYISGDGHVRMKGNSKEIMFSTVSFELFLGLQLIVAKLYSRICSMYVRKDNRKQTFNDSYNCQVIPSSSSTCQEVIEDKIVTRISKIEYIDEVVDVFNFEVETDNSYTINNIIVHNCQDLSLSGKLGGMEEGSGTRSSLLWEVERILKECKEKGNLPNTLLMENVPQVIGTKNKSSFHKFTKRLEDLGYKNFVKVLNAKDFYIPQNRQRCFMVSILTKEDVFSFPNKMKLDYYLLDFLDKEVDEKYYLSDKMINFFNENSIKQKEKGNGFQFKPTFGDGSRMDDNFITCKNKRLTETLKKLDNVNEVPLFLDTYNQKTHSKIVGTITTRVSSSNNSFLLVPENTKKGYAEAKVGDGVYINRPHQKRGVVQKGMIQTIKTSCDDIGVVVDEPNCLPKHLRIRKLTPCECYKLMGFTQVDYERCAKIQSNATIYHQAGDSIVVTVLIAIFGKLLGIDYEKVIKEYVKGEILNESKYNI